MKTKTFVRLLTLSIFIISYIVAGVITIKYYDNPEWNARYNIEVTGTVVAKNVKAVHHKHNRISEEYIMVVRPDNSTYKTFQQNVPFISYSTFNVGDRVMFDNIDAYKLVNTKYEKSYAFTCLYFLTITTLILCVLLIVFFVWLTSSDDTQDDYTPTLYD